MIREPTSIVAEITRAFGTLDPPRPENLLIHELDRGFPFEAEELTALLKDRSWTDLSRKEIEEHPDWLIYLSPQAFIYYLPAWLVYSIDYDNADYPAFFILRHLRDLDDDYRSLLTAERRGAIRLVYSYLRDTFPMETIPTEPEYLSQDA